MKRKWVFGSVIVSILIIIVILICDKTSNKVKQNQIMPTSRKMDPKLKEISYAEAILLIPLKYEPRLQDRFHRRFPTCLIDKHGDRVYSSGITVGPVWGFSYNMFEGLNKERRSYNSFEYWHILTTSE